jgi:hypothetical protein
MVNGMKWMFEKIKHRAFKPSAPCSGHLDRWPRCHRNRRRRCDICSAGVGIALWKSVLITVKAEIGGAVSSEVI